MKKPKVCVIIPALNEEVFIGKLIDSIKNQSYSSTEIIVVDDGSTDNTKEICRAKGVLLLENKPGRRGPAFGWNRAAKQTSAEIICILGADFFLEDKKFIEKSAKAFDEKTAAVYNSYHTIQDTWVEKALTSEHGVSLEPRFVRRKDFLEFGGFPEIGFGEDQVFIARLEKHLKKKGLGQKMVKAAFFSGHGVHTIQEMYKQAKWYGKTSIPFLAAFSKETGVIGFLKALLSVYLRLAYFVSFIFLVLSGFFPPLFVLGFPFMIILLLLFVNSATESIREKNPFKILKPFLFLLFGLGMLHGLSFRLLGIDRRMGG